MGVVTLALIADHRLGAKAGPPFWVILMCGLAIALGTYLGGWRVIRTVGHRLVQIESPQGFAAETASAAVLLISTHGGAPLSTTHITTGSVIGSGLGKKAAQVKWGVAGRMVAAWVLTIPAAAATAALIGLVTKNGNAAGVAIVTVLAVVVLAGCGCARGATPSPRTTSTPGRTPRRRRSCPAAPEEDEMAKLIDWSVTGQILVESVAAGVVIVAAFALGARHGRGRADAAGRRAPAGRSPSGPPRLCFLVALVGVGIGVWFTVDK